MSCIAAYCAVFHCFEMSSYDNILAACNCYEEIAQRSCLIHGHDFVAFHKGLACLNRVDLSNDYLCAKALSSHGNAPAAHSVTCDNYSLSSYNEICRSHDRSPDRLACSEPVVEKVLASCIINSDYGIKELIFTLKDLKSVNTCSGLFAAALDTGCHIL